MEKIKLRFVANKTFISFIVRLFTRSKYSHVDYIFDDGRAFSCLPKNGVGFNTNKNHVEVFCEVEVKSKYMVEKFLLEQEGKPYDWKAIISWPFLRDWQSTESWFCSELIAAAITYSNHEPLFHERHHRVTPRDLFIHTSIKELK